ncbi:hypothetical protein FOPG_19854 [Fusarium oxysporum f. sp. conglutinans race 2 54008]|uniref:Uncharacterized protein n=1 Tax=Fusarium oxysporum f. sp. conglutinans race 2 54008 TaxID=1089457 RepID=X0HRR8_FUSOX|nr:hypothetical protein FOPG_19854 [Fusarium oxysporum f. sp. conglutinans race 2 54008]
MSWKGISSMPMLIGHWNNGHVCDRNILGHPQIAIDSTGPTLCIRTRQMDAPTCAAMIPLVW